MIDSRLPALHKVQAGRRSWVRAMTMEKAGFAPALS